MNTKETFISLLKSTKRQGVDSCIEELENLGFLTAPASLVTLLQTSEGLASFLLEERK